MRGRPMEVKVERLRNRLVVSDAVAGGHPSRGAGMAQFANPRGRPGSVVVQLASHDGAGGAAGRPGMAGAGVL